MTTVPCPRCGMPMGLEELICTNCRTPRDDMEMEEGRALVRKEELRLKRRPRIIAACVAAAVILIASWFLRGFMTAPLRDSWNEFQAEVEKTRQPSHWKKDSLAEPLTASEPRTEVAISSFVYLNASPQMPQAAYESPPPDSNAAPAEPAAPVQPSDSTNPTALPLSSTPQPGELRIQGLVYDLATNLPVSNVSVRFQRPENGAKWEALTNAAGRYQVGLYKNPSETVTVMIEAPGYRTGLIEDRDPPYRERTARARADLIAETTDNDLEPVPVRYPESSQIVELDLCLIPQVKN